MFFFNKVVSLPTKNGSVLDRTPLKEINTIKTLIREIEINYINDEETSSTKSFSESITQAKSYPFFQDPKRMASVNKIESGTASQEIILHFLQNLLSQILTDKEMSTEDKKSFFQCICNHHIPNIKGHIHQKLCIGLYGLNNLIFRQSEASKIEKQKLNLRNFEVYFTAHTRTHTEPPLILGFFGSHEICPIHVKDLDAFAGFILKQEIKTTDGERNNHSYSLYFFDEKLKKYIKNTLRESEHSLLDQEDVFNLDTLRSLCHDSPEDESKMPEGERNSKIVEYTVEADIFETPRSRLSVKNDSIKVTCRSTLAKCDTPLTRLLLNSQQYDSSIQRRLFSKEDLLEGESHKPSPQASSSGSASESDNDDTTASSDPNIPFRTPDISKDYTQKPPKPHTPPNPQLVQNTPKTDTQAPSNDSQIDGGVVEESSRMSVKQRVIQKGTSTTQPQPKQVTPKTDTQATSDASQREISSLGGVEEESSRMSVRQRARSWGKILGKDL